MYTGTDMKKAIKAWQKGRDVRVLDRNAVDCAGNIQLIPLNNLLKGYEFLVDVEAVIDPEFEEAVNEMVGEGKLRRRKKGAENEEL